MVFSVCLCAKMLCRSAFVCRRLFRDFTYNSFVQKAEYKSAYSLENLYPHLAVKNASSVPESKPSEPKKDEFSGVIPIDDLNISYTRSSGPGGQNVNKVNTKVEIRFHVQSAKWIPDWIKPNLMEKEAGRITKDGYLIVSSDKTRKQMLNQADCLEKIRALVYESSIKPYEPTKEDLDKLRLRQDREKAKMLLIKKSHSMKKQSRQAPSQGDF